MTTAHTFDLCDQKEHNEDSLTQCLKIGFTNNVVYSKISDSALVSINPYKLLPPQSPQYVAEYKDTGSDALEPLPTHIYKLTNQAYLHMRRTGIDQSLILSGETGSGKTENFKCVMNHLVHLSSQKKETKLQSQIADVQIILEAFGNARTSSNMNASRFGKYVELQFNERGRMIGAKVLNYLLDKSRITHCPSYEQTFHIFYQLLGGASAEEKTILQLDDELPYKYIPRTMAASGGESNQFKDIKQAMRVLGISKKYQARIWQFLACLLHLGQLEFMDDSTLQEASFVKNTATLDLCADFLGVDPQSLESVLTYKTQLIKKDVTTMILDSAGASKQRDDIVKALYSLMFTWLVEYINIKLCNDNVHNFIGILDLPGPNLSSNNNFPNSFNSFCNNLANERLQNFCLRSIFDMNIEEYKMDGLSIYDVPYFNNQPCVELLIRPKQGLTDLTNHYAKSLSSYTDLNLLDAYAKYNNNHANFSLRSSETSQRFFSVQHFTGQVIYNPVGFLESNKDVLNPDLVQLIRGSETSPQSYNSFVLELFTENTIRTENHPKQKSAIMNAQQTSSPLRGPSMRRSKSTKRQRMSVVEPTIQEESSKSKKSVSMLLSQVNSSLNDLFTTLEETVPWYIFCIKPNENGAPNQFDSSKVRSQLRAWGIPQICDRMKTSYTISYFFDEFIERFSCQWEVSDRNLSARDQCEMVIASFGFSDSQAKLGNSKIFLSEMIWEQLEDVLRTNEKEDQKRSKDEKRVNENISSLAAPVMITVDRDQSTETLSNISVGSNTDFLLPHATRSDYSLIDRRQGSSAAAAAARLPLPRGIATGGSVYTDDQRSFLSDDNYYHNNHQASSYNGSESHYGSDIYTKQIATNEMKEMLSTAVVEEETPEESEVMSSGRRHWLNFVWLMTWWIPTIFLVMCGKMKRADIQIAWREKFTLCMGIFLTSGFIIWFLVFFGALVCPRQDVFSISELQSHSDSDKAYVAIRGEVFDLTEFAPRHWANQVVPEKSVIAYAGKDASSLFPVQVSALCQGISGSVSEYVSLDFNPNLTDPNARYHNFLPSTEDPRPDWYYEKMTFMRKNYKLGSMGFTPKDILRQSTQNVDMNGIQTPRRWAILNNHIYDLTFYIMGGRRFDIPAGIPLPDPAELNFMDTSVVTLFSQKAGEDITESWKALPLSDEVKKRQEVCLRNLFFVGAVDQRNSVRCLFAEYLLLIVTVFLCLVIVFKFLAALQFRTRREPEKLEKFVICQVPCYTEGEDELKKTIDSIAALQYDDKRKLLFIICDGMIVGGGNDRPTPRIVLDILGVDPNIDPEALSFFSVGEGQKQHNMAKIYSGLYETHGHVVPYIIVVKVGKPSERQKPGNRGKRDSQLVLMNFLNKVHFNSPMTPMELELYHQIKNVIGVNPSFYEFVLMVDADTEVLPDGLNRMVSVFTHDSKIIGLCGETVLSNEKDSWVTMIQVYEYFISHYLIKAFESLFGTVTCLPGCFCMYRIRAPQKNQPLLISNQIISDYSINKVDTLHKKNLLHLGEDRYLTTLILKHFPNYKTKFVSDARCATNAPDQWSVLLSQRRRWINSTIHNLGELVFLPQLCGFCCFSMRFVVMLDLLSTLVQPAIVGYLVYLIYTLVTSTSGVPVMSMITIAGVYGLQAIIFLLHRKWEHIIWMIVSIFAIPVFSFMIPIYAYWHFDDFSWGNTRVVMGEKGKKIVMQDEGKFDPKSIPLMTWEEYENSVYEEGNGGKYFDDNASIGSHGSSYKSGYSQGTYYSQQTYGTRPGQYNMTQTNTSYMVAPQSIRGGAPSFNLPAYQPPIQSYSSPSAMNYNPGAGHFRAQSPFH
ncbi:chitin synthase-domain-containing protein [Pilobolus umbonatus]|nr:chitin synthase-domain-containing protein [Pilobolus umbonatus]